MAMVARWAAALLLMAELRSPVCWRHRSCYLINSTPTPFRATRAAGGRRADRAALIPPSARSQLRDRARLARSLAMLPADTRLTLPPAPASMLPTRMFRCWRKGRKSRLVELAMSFCVDAVSVVRQREGRQVGRGDGVRAIARRQCDGCDGSGRISLLTLMSPPLVGLTSGLARSAASAAPSTPPADSDAAGLIFVAASPSSGTRTVGKAEAGPLARTPPTVVLPENCM